MLEFLQVKFDFEHFIDSEDLKELNVNSAGWAWKMVIVKKELTDRAKEENLLRL